MRYPNCAVQIRWSRSQSAGRKTNRGFPAGVASGGIDKLGIMQSQRFSSWFFPYVRSSSQQMAPRLSFIKCGPSVDHGDIFLLGVPIKWIFFSVPTLQSLIIGLHTWEGDNTHFLLICFYLFLYLVWLLNFQSTTCLWYGLIFLPQKDSDPRKASELVWVHPPELGFELVMSFT